MTARELAILVTVIVCAFTAAAAAIIGVYWPTRKEHR